MHRCLEKYPRFEDFMFLDVHKIMNLLPLLEAALPPSEKEQLERAYAILELIKNDYLHAEEDAFMFTKDGILCEEAEADTFFFCTGLTTLLGQPVFLYCIPNGYVLPNGKLKTRWYVVDFRCSPCQTAAPLTPGAPAAPVGRPTAPGVRPAATTVRKTAFTDANVDLFDLVYTPGKKIIEFVPLLLSEAEKATFSEGDFRARLSQQFREKGSEACRFTKNDQPCAPDEADKFIFITGLKTPAGMDIVMQCEHSTLKGPEPWFGKYYSAGWEDPATLNDVYDKILISDKQLTSFLQNLCSVYDKSPANMRADIAKYYLRLKPEEVHYFSGNCVTNDERSADHMAFPTGYYHTDEHGEREEIMLRCAVNTRVPGHKWIARRFYLCSENSFYGRQPQKWLVTWAKFSSTNPNDIDGVVRDLKSMAMPEAWSFSGTDDLSVLRNYFVYTFTRLWREKKVLINVKTNFAAFNTGLVNSTYEYIYAMFRPQNSNDIRRWCFVGFAIEGAAGLGKDLVRSFPKPPHPARYFQKNVPIYYVFNDQEKIQVQIPSYDVEHILLQRTNRLPVSFMQKYLDKVPGLPECYEKARRLQERERVRRQPGQERDPQTQGYDAAAKYAWKELAQLLEGAPDVYLAMKYALGNAVVTAIKRTSWNYRTVIPYYSPKDNKLCLLLPITLGTGDAPDLVMVLEPTEDGAYLGHTVITLAMAYNNSRLVCRPESEWLNMGMIKNAAADEDALDDGDDETDLAAEDDA